MLVHAATKDVKTAAASPRGIAILHCSQLEHVEVPRGVINVEAVIKDVGAIAIVNLGPHQIGQTDLLAAEFWERTNWHPDKLLLECPCHYSMYDPKEGAKVVSGPSPRRLPSLPLKIVDERLVVAKPFIGRAGFQQM